GVNRFETGQSACDGIGKTVPFHSQGIPRLFCGDASHDILLCGSLYFWSVKIVKLIVSGVPKVSCSCIVLTPEDVEGIPYRHLCNRRNKYWRNLLCSILCSPVYPDYQILNELIPTRYPRDIVDDHLCLIRKKYPYSEIAIIAILDCKPVG